MVLPWYSLPVVSQTKGKGGRRSSSIVDTSLIDALLRLEPVERLLLNDRTVRMIHELRHGFSKARTSSR